MGDENAGLAAREGQSVSWQAIQDDLPAGLTIVRQRHGAGVFGRVFELRDARLLAASPVKRVARVLPDLADMPGCEQAVQIRLQQLLAEPAPFVDTPREVFRLSDGAWCLLGDAYRRSLWTCIQSHEGVSGRPFRSALRRILEGLAALHQRGLAHGDLRPKNIYLNGQGDGVSDEVWIGDTAIGELAHCSRGALLDADAGYYYPPEWQGVQKPSPKADVYALGLLCCEALAGQKANPRRGDDPAEGEQALRDEADAALRDKGVDAGLRKFIGLLLADEGSRPSSAVEALRAFDQGQHRMIQRPWRLAAACAMLVVIVMLTFFWRQRVASQELTDNLAQSETQQLALKEQRDALQGELRSSQESLHDLRRRMATGPEAPPESPPRPVRNVTATPARAPKPPDPRDVAMTWWEAYEGRNFKGFDDEFEPLRKSNAEAAKLVANWKQAIRGLDNEAKAWFSSDPWMRELYSDVWHGPWDQTKLKTAQDYLDNLRTAAEKWDEWAADSQLTDARLLQAINGESSSVQKILLRWHGQVAGRTKWTLRLTSGKANAGLGKARVITLYSGDDAPSTAVHDWKSETSHVYDSKPKTSQLSFGWAPDQPVRIIAEGDWSYWLAGVRSNLIDKTFDGPLAVCQLNKAGHIADGGLTLNFEVIDCPGPPRSWRKSLPKPADFIEAVTNDN